MPEDESKYIHIGTCKAVSTAGNGLYGNKNNATEEIKECACQNGGDIVQITEHVESFDYDDFALNPNSNKRIHQDGLIGKVFIKKEN